MPELKVTQKHLEHDAYLYIRQSTPRQVLENTESTQRQYALRDRAVSLGWPAGTGFRSWLAKSLSARRVW
jgi:DNA invertase Pin-like site-specific DNA recombinase